MQEFLRKSGDLEGQDYFASLQEAHENTIDTTLRILASRNMDKKRLQSAREFLEKTGYDTKGKAKPPWLTLTKALTAKRRKHKDIFPKIAEVAQSLLAEFRKNKLKSTAVRDTLINLKHVTETAEDYLDNPAEYKKEIAAEPKLTTLDRLRLSIYAKRKKVKETKT